MPGQQSPRRSRARAQVAQHRHPADLAVRGQAGGAQQDGRRASSAMHMGAERVECVALQRVIGTLLFFDEHLVAQRMQACSVLRGSRTATTSKPRYGCMRRIVRGHSSSSSSVASPVVAGLGSSA
jgi:hypothetical protein